MPTVNFSVPEDIKSAFNITFEGQNKSALVAELMREAVESTQSQQCNKDAFQRILKRRQNAPSVTEVQILTAREEGRPWRAQAHPAGTAHGSSFGLAFCHAS